ncbi:MAG TPA: NAD(P)-dependent oxidoreductase [Vicinamibacterales bacterium]|nr:NAD(P)-dependent oxidoreductase [Vicinamibacterales bacterium]
MKIFVAGATGVAGWRSVRELVAAGHEVTALARTHEKAKLIDDLGGKPVSFDVFDAADVKAHAAGHDVVVNLLTHIPRMSKTAVPGSFKENDRLRLEASGNLAAASDGRLIQESITFPYGDHGDEWITEESTRVESKFLASVNTAEANALALEGGVVLRFAQFYSADSHHTLDQVRAARRGLAALPGKTDGYWTLVHCDDVATAVVAALGAPAGVYNIAEDEPMTRRQGAQALADALGKKKVRTGLTGLAGKVPSQTISVMTGSERVSNAKFKAATGWAPQVPSQREGWPRILDEMKS